MPEIKRNDKTGIQKDLGIKKREGADTLNNKVNELKGYFDKFMGGSSPLCKTIKIFRLG